MAATPELALTAVTELVKDKRFNLVDEPWIMALDVESGSASQHGLKALFLHAHTLDGPIAGTDVERWALRFLLVALAQDMIGSGAALASDNQFDPALVEKYFADSYDRLWLIHPTDPFMQQAELAQRGSRVSEDKKAPGVVVVPTNTVKTLSVDLGAGSKHTWWQHTPDDINGDWFSYSLAQAASLLIARSFFGEPGNEQRFDGATGGSSPAGLYAHAADGDGLLLVARQGKTLYETLRANIPEVDTATRNKLPAADFTSTKGVTRPLNSVSTVEAALWTPKATLLIPEGDRVRFILRGTRRVAPSGTEKTAIEEQRKANEFLIRADSPFTITKSNKKGEQKFVWSTPARSAWRELDAISNTFRSEKDAGSSPSILNRAKVVFTGDSSVETLSCTYAGTAATAVLSGWVASTIPNYFLLDYETIVALALHLQAGGIAAECEKALRMFARMALLPKHEPGGKLTVDWSGDDPPILQVAVADFWTGIEQRFADLAEIFAQRAPGDPGRTQTPDVWRDDVKDTTKRIAVQLFDAVDQMDPARLITVSKARSEFMRYLRRI